MNTNEQSNSTARGADDAIIWASKGQRRKIFGISRRTNDADIAEGIKNGTLRVKSFGQRCLRIAVPLADIPADGVPQLRRLQEPKVTAAAKRDTQATGAVTAPSSSAANAGKPLPKKRRTIGNKVRS